jgi:hypothetical protein
MANLCRINKLGWQTFAPPTKSREFEKCGPGRPPGRAWGGGGRKIWKMFYFSSAVKLMLFSKHIAQYPIAV